MTRKPTGPRGRCPACGDIRALRRDGIIREHRIAPVERIPVRDWAICKGSGQVPRAAS